MINFMKRKCTFSCFTMLIIILILGETWAADKNLWKYNLYLDLGYGYNFNKPENNLWRSKSTTYIFDTPKLNLALGYLGKEAIKESPWGMELGIQAGVDVDGLVPSPPPEAYKPKANADLLRYLYRANATYRFPLGNGLKVTAGLINSFIAYESYLRLFLRTSIYGQGQEQYLGFPGND